MISTFTLSAGDNTLRCSTFGGQLLQWHHQGRPILWLSELADLTGNSPIRGGVPISFPWFAEQFPPAAKTLPKHGFARTQQWQLLKQQSHSLTLQLTDNSTTLALWPHRFALTLKIQLSGSELDLCLTIANTDDQPWQCGAALHSYFACDNAAAVEVAELTGRDYFNSLQQGRQQQFHSDCLPNPIDAIVPNLMQIKTLGLNISHQGNDSTVIWNPAEQHPSDVSTAERQQFICLESVIALAPITLAPSQQHQLRQRIALQS
ncbi:hypothetical protein [Ferrimonas senticii]|uniref:aldose epimerase family protein n=1 Tax=Ferrimonas senticii TaxID=394566 RepID=UPI0004295A1A|nr:hypothetical protein [Ferrimonas senticii]